MRSVKSAQSFYSSFYRALNLNHFKIVMHAMLIDLRVYLSITAANFQLICLRGDLRERTRVQADTALLVQYVYRSIIYRRTQHCLYIHNIMHLTPSQQQYICNNLYTSVRVNVKYAIKSLRFINDLKVQLQYKYKEYKQPSSPFPVRGSAKEIQK